MTRKLARALGLLAVPLGLATLAPHTALAQSTGTVRGHVVESGSNRPVSDVQVIVVGSTQGAVTNAAGDFTIANVPAGTRQLRARRIGFSAVDQTVTVTANGMTRADFTLTANATQLDQVVVTALGQTAQTRALGTAQQMVAGPEIAQTQRENFLNSLQGRIAGVQVNSTSGVPGASTSITIRGVSSISSSNQPLFIIDGLPMDNKTFATNTLGSDVSGSATAFNNRGVDFTNRGADINPEDIESITVLKGPEAAALYGIDAANGAIIITTKRGKAGQSSFEYSNSFRVDNVRKTPDLQRVYGPTAPGSSIGSFQYFGAPYAPGTTFYDNVGDFFQTGLTQKHNLAFGGAAADNKINYRVSSSLTKVEGVIPNSKYDKINLTGASGAQVTKWLKADLSMQYAYTNNDQPFKGDGGPFLGLMLWPQTDNAADYLSPSGTRRRITLLSSSGEIDNPWFNVEKNRNTSKVNRIIVNGALTLTKFSWGDLSTRLGADAYSDQKLLLRHPESYYGFSSNGIIDNADDITRSINSQTLLSIKSRKVWKSLSAYGTLGNAVQDYRSNVDALVGRDFLEPNFVSVNNANLKSSRTTITQRRLVSAFGSMTVDWNKYFYVTVTGRNDWTSTIPVNANSFFYPSVNSSLILTDAIPALRKVFGTAKLRGGYAEVGKDARPYAFRPALQYKTTSYGGYGYDFWGPNANLKPEFAKSSEVGADLTWFDDRLGLEVTAYRKQTKDQIVNDIRGSYATGFVLFNLNAASTRNQGLEITARATPVQTNGFNWDVTANFDKSKGRTLSLPSAFPEAYVSDTWLYGDVRNGTRAGLSTTSLTGRFYLRNNAGQLLIDPTTGLPLRQPSGTFVDAGYDRQPDFTLGLTNSVRYKKFKLDVLMDFRKGGDVFDATDHFLTTRGLSASTLDRETPRVIDGVLRDGKENSTNPTKNTIVVIPAVTPSYYTGMSEELFIEKDINWVRLRDVTLSYQLPPRIARNASVFVTGTDLFLITNYTGLDPVSNGNSAAVGGSGGVGIDYGNFPLPRAVNFGLRLGF